MLENDRGSKKKSARKQAPDPEGTVSESEFAKLESFVGYNLRRAAARQRERFRSIFDRYEIRPVQLTVLALIRESMPLKQSELGRSLEMKRANVVTVLEELIQRGLVSRELADNDRRSYVLYLTPSGKRLTNKLLALHERLEQDLARTFGQKELSKLVDLLRAFRQLDPNPRLGKG